MRIDPKLYNMKGKFKYMAKEDSKLREIGWLLREIGRVGCRNLMK